MTQKEKIYLEAQSRTAKRTINIEGRKRKLIPAIIYGPKIESTPAFLSEGFFAISNAIAGSTIYTLKGDVLEGEPVMIKEIKKNPIGNKILHVDLYSPDMTGTMVVEVPLDFQGEPEGVKEGGVMQEVRRSIELECPVTKIPESIPVDVSGLQIGDTLSMGDIKVPEEFKVISALEYAVVNVSEVKVESDPETPASEGGEGAEAAGGASASAGAATEGATPSGEGKEAKSTKEAKNTKETKNTPE